MTDDDEGDMKVEIPEGSVGSHGSKQSAGASSIVSAGIASTSAGGTKQHKPRPAPLHKLGAHPRGSRPTSPSSGAEHTAEKVASPHAEHSPKTTDHAAALLQIQMKNRENALLERERALERRIAENDKVIEEKVNDMLEAKRQFESRLKKSLSQAGYVKK